LKHNELNYHLSWGGVVSLECRCRARTLHAIVHVLSINSHFARKNNMWSISVVLMKACFFRQAKASASGRLALIMGVRSGETASRPAKVFYIVPLDI
jgi:hypothetical protein